MEVIELARLVYCMRRAQIAANRSYSVGDSFDAVRLEAEVDRAIMRIFDEAPGDSEGEGDDLLQRD